MRAGLDPGFQPPVVALDLAHHVQERAAVHRVAGDVAIGSKPLRRHRTPQMLGKAFHRRKAAPSHDAGEFRRRRPEQLLADARMQAVGADQDVACDLPAVFEL